MVSLAIATMIVLVGRRDHAEDRPEDLLLGDGGAVVDAGEHRGLDEPAPVEMARPAAAGDQRRPLVQPLGDVALHPIALAGRGQWAELRRGVERVPYLHRRERGRQGVDELVVAAFGHHDPGEGRADLAGEEALGSGQGAGGVTRGRRRRG